jgi:hypothetical protein
MKGFMKYTTEMASSEMLYIQIGIGIQAIWFSLRNFRGCNISITDRRDL